uniref:Uncharacterized protein n=1 Tax=Arundo donax TaxID=35708 RepID=A0A0A9B596_ARUDO
MGPWDKRGAPDSVSFGMQGTERVLAFWDCGALAAASAERSSDGRA